MLESSADTDYEIDDADLKSFLDSKKKEYGQDSLREMLREQLADVESEIFYEKLIPESIDDMSEKSYELFSFYFESILLLESIKTTNDDQLVSHINQYWF